MGNLSERFRKALVFADELHQEQSRKGSDIPYVAHLLSVAGIVLEHGGTKDEAIAALLHDSVEDQGGLKTAARIRRRFGQTVYEIVMGCTDAIGEPKPEWKGRKEKYLAHLAGASDSILLVSAADKLHNARAILRDYKSVGEALWSRFKGGREGTLWYYRTLISVYRGRWSSPLVEELDKVFTELESLCDGNKVTGREIERKFLVKGDRWRKLASGVVYRQGYLNSAKERTVRIRVAGDKAFLTIKGITVGASRLEYEYEIPPSDCNAMLDALAEKPLIEKKRYNVLFEGNTWEIDEFSGDNTGLIVAEIELRTEDQLFNKPDWVGEEVTGDPRYFNSNLIRHPFTAW